MVLISLKSKYKLGGIINAYEENGRMKICITQFPITDQIIAKSTDKPGFVTFLRKVMIIYLGPLLPTTSCDLTRGRNGPFHSPPIRSCSRWGLQGQPVTRLPVSSYLAFPPLPKYSYEYPGGISLLHFP